MPTRASAAISSEVAIGRRMKGSEMFITSRPVRAAGGLRSSVSTTGAGLEPRLAVHHDLFAGREALGDDRRSSLLTGIVSIGALVHGIVRLDDPGIEAVGPRCTATGGIVTASLRVVDQNVDAHELARPQPLVGIGEFRLELDRAGGLIDLIVDEEQMAFRQLLLVVLVEGENRDRALQHRLAHRAEVALRQREDHRARLDLRQHRERIRDRWCG